MRKIELKEINGADGYKSYIVKYIDSTGSVFDLKQFATLRKAQNYIKKNPIH